MTVIALIFQHMVRHQWQTRSMFSLLLEFFLDMLSHLLQATSQHLLGYERAPYPPDLLGIPPSPGQDPPACLAAADCQPIDMQADAPLHLPENPQQGPAPVSETPLTALSAALHGLQSLPAGNSDAAACNNNAMAAHKHGETAAQVQPIDRAEASGTTVTEASAAGDNAWSIASVPAHVDHLAGSNEGINVQSVQVGSADLGSAMPVLQQNDGQQQQQTSAVAEVPVAEASSHQGPAAEASSHQGPMAQVWAHQGPAAEAGAHQGPVAEAGSYQGPVAEASSYQGPVAEASSHQGPAAGGSPDQSNAGLWRPVVDFPVYSITEVACIQLLPEFLEDITQV